MYHYSSLGGDNMTYNPKLDMFNRNILSSGTDVVINGEVVRVLVVDKNVQNLSTNAKECYVPLDKQVVRGTVAIIDNEKYFITNVVKHDTYFKCLLQRYTHVMKVKYPNYPLMQYDVIVDNTMQSTVSGGAITDMRVGECIIYLKKDDLLQNGTRFYLFNTIYEIISLVWECDDLYKCFCKIGQKKEQDNDITQVADNSHITPPKQEFIINATSGANGTISPTGEVKVEEGTNATFTFTPNSGYELDTVTVDGNVMTISDNKYTFTNVVANHTISITFKEVVVVQDAIVGESDMWMDLEEIYTITNKNNQPCTWTVSESRVKILSQTNRSVELLCDYTSSLNYKTFTLTATYGNVVLTKEIRLIN